MTSILKWWLAAALLIGSAFGLARLEARVHAAPRLNQPPVIELVDVPAGLRDTLRSKLAPFESRARFDTRICTDIGRALEVDPWVRRVKSVRRAHDMRVLVRCEFRMPVAMVQRGSEFFLLDEEQVRLPGVYGPHEALPLIQGVASDPPAPGRIWAGDDLAAGLRLARLIAREPFARQITGIQVHNHKARRSAKDAQIELSTDRAGGRIKWGSPPGEEVEENSVRQKMAILRHNYERFGRVDAGLGVIDISVYPDRFTAEG